MADETGASARTAFTRKPDRGSHDLAEARAVLAEALIGHVGTVDPSGAPLVLPVAIALDPDADRVLFHGSTGAGMFRLLAAGAPACLTVTHLDGLVIARSAFESSMNYRSVVVLGTCEVLVGADKHAALRVITDHLTPGRWDAARPMRSSEVAATLVLALPLAEFSVKSRDGGPNDDEDAPWPVWAGHVPVRMVAAAPIPAPGSDAHPAPQVPDCLLGPAR
jgi:nitroimidazol reductase NimA-like FMN-containing flavoprotein (pyridoxamine 5'-phosphate oxidase superfamily)